VLFELLTP